MLSEITTLIAKGETELAQKLASRLDSFMNELYSDYRNRRFSADQCYRKIIKEFYQDSNKETNKVSI